MVSRPERVLRGQNAPLSASFLELFFDLAFVLALSQLARHLLADITPVGALRTALLLAAVWWMWVTTTWLTDWYDPETPVIRILLIGATLGSLLVGVATPLAVDGRASLFAGAYVAVHLGRGVITGLALRGHPRQSRALRILCWFSVSAIPWLVGAFVPAWRMPLWLLGLAIDLTGPRLGWPTPMFGRARQEELHLAGQHLAERYQQVVIVALGELILVSGLAYAGTHTSLPQTVAFLLIFATAVLIGLLYVTPSGVHLGSAIERSDPSRFGTTSAYLHLLMIAGVVYTAVGAELTIVHPTEVGSRTAVAVLAAGPTLFLTGRLLLSVAIARRLSWPRLLGLFAMVAAALATITLPLLAVTAATTGVLFVVAAMDHRGVLTRRRNRPL
jgi:low temperature requirement protein LtrA